METWKKLKKELLQDRKTAQNYMCLRFRYQLTSQLIKTRTKKGTTRKKLRKFSSK